MVRKDLNFTTCHYRSGKENILADALLRQLWDQSGLQSPEEGEMWSPQKDIPQYKKITHLCVCVCM